MSLAFKNKWSNWKYLQKCEKNVIKTIEKAGRIYNVYRAKTKENVQKHKIQIKETDRFKSQNKKIE